MAHPGPRCDVEGCGRPGIVRVFLDDSELDNAGSIHENEDLADLNVCAEHGPMLGTVETPTGTGVHEVTVDPVKAEGWRIAISVRKSGRWAVVMIEPGDDREP